MISLVIPFYNEATRIHLLKEGLKNYKNNHQLIKELILVDDGSTDNTLQLLNDIKNNFDTLYDIQILPIKLNQGKGNAIKNGVMEARQPWILCNDADLSYSMEQIDDWREYNWLQLTTPNTVYIGSRELGSKHYDMKLFLHRKVIGRIFAFFIQLITGIPIKDTQCGFKLYPGPVAKNVFKKIKETRFAFDVEVLYLLKKDNINIQLLPVKCIDTEGSKVNILSDGWDMFKALFRIKRNHQ